VTPETILRELAGLQALARSLVHGDADADDLLQETAIAALEHPPHEDRPVRPWLVTVLLNRRRMDLRGRSRRKAREEAVGGAPVEAVSTPDAIDRARTLERVASALVALDEPFRDVVIRRYLDGQSAADIARALGIPAGTVRWRLKTGLARLRVALDESTPRWRRALLPLTAVKGAVLVKAKTTALSLLLLLLLIGAAVFVLVLRRHGDDKPGAGPVVASTPSAKSPPLQIAAGSAADDRGQAGPVQTRAVVETIAAEGGAASGRVINWSTGEGVGGAELTFVSAAGATTVRAGSDGSFELAAKPSTYSLATIIAPGFLPYAPEFEHSPVRIALAPKQAVRGITVFLFPALDYNGIVVDGTGAPVAGAKVRLVDSPRGEQTLEKIVTEWTTDKQGKFVFHAPDNAVFEASRGGKRGWAILDGSVQTTKQMKIEIGDAAARDATIRGKTVDSTGQPLPDVLVTAIPEDPPGAKNTPGTKVPPRSIAFATSGPDGAFAFDGLDRKAYTLTAELEEFAPVRLEHVVGGTRNVVVTLDGGKPLAGTVRDPDDQPVPAYTLLVTRRQGLLREVVSTRFVIDPRGRFSLRVPEGSYELLASARGWAPSAPVPVSAGTTDVKIELGAGATLRGTVADETTGAPLQYARVQLEGAGGGASAQPANAGTVTRSDGTFELTGIPAGPFTISTVAGEHHPRLDGLVATNGGALGPIKITLKQLAAGETPALQFVGIGVALSADGDALRVDRVIPNSGAAAAGIVAGDHIIAIDGIAVTTLGMDAAIGKIRGVAHTKVGLTLRRGDQELPLVVERLPLLG